MMRLSSKLYPARRWYGMQIGEEAPTVPVCCVEIVPTDSGRYKPDETSWDPKREPPTEVL